MEQLEETTEPEIEETEQPEETEDWEEGEVVEDPTPEAVEPQETEAPAQPVETETPVEPEETENQEDLISGTDERGRRTIAAVILSTFVTAAIGIVTSKLIDDGAISIKFTCAGFIVTACLLVISSMIEKKSVSAAKMEKQQKGISWIQALFIGFMQGIGTLPGIS